MHSRGQGAACRCRLKGLTMYLWMGEELGVRSVCLRSAAHLMCLCGPVTHECPQRHGLF